MDKSNVLFLTHEVSSPPSKLNQSINQSINQFNSGDVAHTRTRETDEQTEAADRKNSTTQKNILKTCGEMRNQSRVYSTMEKLLIIVVHTARICTEQLDDLRIEHS